MRRYKKIYFLLCLFFCSSRLAAQEALTAEQDSLPPRDQFVWFSGGAGVVGPLFGVRVALSYAKGIDCFTGIFSAGESFATDAGNGRIMEYALCYGRQNYTDGTLGRLSLGIAYFEGEFGYGEEFKTFGVVGEAEGILKLSAVGIGLSAGLRVSPKFVSPLFTLNVYFGKLQ